RPFREEFTLDRSGFRLLDHRSAVTDFASESQLESAYAREVSDLVKQVTGADEVISLGWLRRAAKDTAGRGGAALPPAPDVHVDLYDGRWALRYASAHARGPLPEPGTYRRALWTSLWRTFSPPPQDWPLALCDYPSLSGEEGRPNLLFRVPAVPSPAEEAEFADDAAESAAAVFEYRPEHRWWYFPDTHPGEAILIKLHDTDHGVAWRAPHTSFRDPGVTTSRPRESVEFRTVAFFR
ncbi:MAG: hypothetical protein FWE35_26215, partial [Streptosporangiales bacterium]|nr:hypothetical protein [Streptosporangiales bacterium]